MAKKLKYPVEIYCVREESDGESYLIAHEKPEDAAEVNEEIEVAIYKLVRVAKIYSGVKVI